MSDSVPAVRRLRIDLAYDGTDFAGWQFQPKERTVQGVLEDVLSRLQGGAPVTLRLCLLQPARSTMRLCSRHSCLQFYSLLCISVLA